jgi:hypothetical protein
MRLGRCERERERERWREGGGATPPTAHHPPLLLPAQGASCGFGMRGQKSRSGSGVRPGFEGGQTPLYRRVPKLKGIAGGNPAGVPSFVTVNVGQLETECEAGAVVDATADIVEREFCGRLSARWPHEWGGGLSARLLVCVCVLREGAGVQSASPSASPGVETRV